ncbi:MAG: MFS transporter [Kiritimatiellae bacterium]|nr:MFS transporter [Kiritimatiellia bacterium]
MDVTLYTLLSAMMFMQFAVWGAWSPVLAARLLGPLKFTGKQTGWIYGTMALASMVSPLIAGQIADQWLNTEWLLAGSHIIGAVLLLVAAKMDTFKKLFPAMAAYSFFYAATIPLSFSLLFTHIGGIIADPAQAFDAGKIFVWIPVGWVLAGLLLTAWRHAKGEGDGTDCLKLAAGASLIMGILCFFLPATVPPAQGGEALPFIQALGLLKDRNFLLFLVLSFVVFAQLQFYFLGTAQYLGDLGVKGKHIPAAMAIAQAGQIFATYVLLGFFLGKGFQLTLAAGAAAWLTMYLLYAVGKPRIVVILSMTLHGVAYALFVFGGQIYTDVVGGEIKGSAQALLTVVTLGLGLFVGSQFAGYIMDKHCTDGKFNWKKIYLTPCILTAVCAVLFFILFRNPAA